MTRTKGRHNSRISGFLIVAPSSLLSVTWKTSMILWYFENSSNDMNWVMFFTISQNFKKIWLELRGVTIQEYLLSVNILFHEMLKSCQMALPSIIWLNFILIAIFYKLTTYLSIAKSLISNTSAYDMNVWLTSIQDFWLYL